MNRNAVLLRAVGPVQLRDPGVALKCEVERCSRSTREGKPFCSEHIELSPYVNALMSTLATHERELDRVARVGARAVRLDGLMVQEVLHQLRSYGDRTVERLARDLAVDHTLIRSYADRMTKAGIVRLGQTLRGHTCLTLEPGEKRARRIRQARSVTSAVQERAGSAA